MKNPDYTSSAIRLTNPPEIGHLLERLAFLQLKFRQVETYIEDYLKEHCPEIVNLRPEYQKSIADTQELIRRAVEEHGSYQDVEAGAYAVLQAKTRRVYDPDAFAKAPDGSKLRQVAPLVVVHAVDEKALAGLLKGGIVTEQDLQDGGTYSVQQLAPAFILRTGNKEDK